MINNPQGIFLFIRNYKMIFQNDKSIILSILTHTHTQKSESYNNIFQTFNKLFTTKGYYFLRFLSLKGVFFICKTNLSPNLAFSLCKRKSQINRLFFLIRN